MPIVVVGVTTYQGGREGRPQGKGAQAVDRQLPCGTRDAEGQIGPDYHLSPLATGMTAGERGDTETVMPRVRREAL